MRCEWRSLRMNGVLMFWCWSIFRFRLPSDLQLIYNLPIRLIDFWRSDASLSVVCRLTYSCIYTTVLYLWMMTSSCLLSKPITVGSIMVHAPCGRSCHRRRTILLLLISLSSFRLHQCLDSIIIVLSKLMLLWFSLRLSQSNLRLWSCIMYGMLSLLEFEYISFSYYIKITYIHVYVLD